MSNAIDYQQKLAQALAETERLEKQTRAYKDEIQKLKGEFQATILLEAEAD